MITPARGTVVSAASLVLVLTVTLALAACGGTSLPGSWDTSRVQPEQPGTFRFDNTADRSVDVYLVTEQREWRLGRVAPGARAALRVPDAVLASRAGFVRLAVIAGAPMSAQAAREPGATLTIAQPATELLAQRWAFVDRHRSSPQILATRADGGRP